MVNSFIYRIIFAIIGYSIYGFIGLFFGIILGAFLDSLRSKRLSKRVYGQTSSSFFNDASQFEEQLLILIAYVAKSDNNRLLQSEFDYCKKYFAKQFPHSDISQIMLKFRDILNNNDTTLLCQNACAEISSHATIHEKIAILQCLFGFATADGNPHQQEIDAIQNISDLLGISRSTFESLKLLYIGFSYSSSYQDFGGGYYGNTNSGRQQRQSFDNSSGPSLSDCYKILEVSPDASDEEVKKAYRTAAMKHHPDKVGHLGEDVRKQAEEKFAKINEAYDKIKAARGIN